MIPTHRWSAQIPEILVWLVAGLFLFAGVSKYMDFDGFMRSVRSFQLLPGFLVPLWAILVPAIEIGAACACLSTSWRLQGLKVLLGLVFLFTGVIFISWLRDIPLVCDCFGPSQSQWSFAALFHRNAILLGFLFFLTAHFRSASTK